MVKGMIALLLCNYAINIVKRNGAWRRRSFEEIVWRKQLE
jgi:hypothetical protein